jgi:hypothetical protein
MQCYVCSERGRKSEAVALCRHCNAGLCRAHAREAAVQQANTLGWYRCTHEPWQPRT